MRLPMHFLLNMKQEKTVNDSQKIIINYIVCFLFGVIITLSISIPIYITSVRRANNKSIELSNQLYEANRRLIDATDETAACRESVAECRESIARIAEVARTGNGTLTDIINSLKRIRDEAEGMEERFYSLDNNSSNNNRNDSVADIPVEKIGGNL